MTENQPHSGYPTPSGHHPIAPGTSRERRQLLRSRHDRWVGGVCGGLADYFGVDANLVRLLVVLGTVLGFGSLLIAYVAAWVLMPEA